MLLCIALLQARLQKEDKERKRKQTYQKKKWNRYQERSRALRDATGVNGFASLYRVLGLPGILTGFESQSPSPCLHAWHAAAAADVFFRPRGGSLGALLLPP